METPQKLRLLMEVYESDILKLLNQQFQNGFNAGILHATTTLQRVLNNDKRNTSSGVQG